MQNVKLLITDLDDTLWDWLEMWHKSFAPYFERIKIECGIDNVDLAQAFKELHQTYGTTEMSFAYREIPIIEPKNYHLFQNGTEDKKSILHEYYSNKKNNLKLYNGVFDTLNYIKSKGVKIVAFTESYVFFTKYRIKHLGLDGIIDCIYSPMGSDLPLSVYRHYETDYWDPHITKIRPLANDVRKPDPEILDQIVSDFGADKETTIYIGDKLDRDVFMAQQAGITSVYAKYGHRSASDEYDMLVSVTHWTDEDVDRERAFKNKCLNLVEPDYSIDKFSDILNIFNYVKF